MVLGTNTKILFMLGKCWANEIHTFLCLFGVCMMRTWVQVHTPHTCGGEDPFWKLVFSSHHGIHDSNSGHHIYVANASLRLFFSAFTWSPYYYHHPHIFLKDSLTT